MEYLFELIICMFVQACFGAARTGDVQAVQAARTGDVQAVRAVLGQLGQLRPAQSHCGTKCIHFPSTLVQCRMLHVTHVAAAGLCIELQIEGLFVALQGRRLNLLRWWLNVSSWCLILRRGAKGKGWRMCGNVSELTGT